MTSNVLPGSYPLQQLIPFASEGGANPGDDVDARLLAPGLDGLQIAMADLGTFRECFLDHSLGHP